MRLLPQGQPLLARRAAAATVIVGALVGMSATPSSAAFNASTGGARLTVSTTSVGAPSLGSASMSGLTASMSGSKGAKADGWQVASSTTTASDCSTVTYSSFASAGASSYSKAFASADNGKLACFRAQSTLSTWTSVNGNPTTSVRVGLVATSVTLAGSTTGCAAGATCSATITVNFNQPVDPTTVAALTGEAVCFVHSGGTDVIVLADSSASCNRSDSGDLGNITGVTVNPPGNGSSSQRIAAPTYSLSTDGTSLNVRVTAATGLSTVTQAPGTFAPTSVKVKTPSTAAAVPLCSASYCAATATGSI